ncbi:hypothetical protein [Listeria booriae]|uniref:Uncharacterized protein n=1 Tax=Listeria booriae TaxID=1552123 RepID=A0A099WDC5_9LIST|nr:hypothetical protein [Listeria booriae]KGL42962.1 hypothetical protein EP57_05770 [Listeria booriae]MBC1210769.1 hypothetical protein [Listeria booriae]MBC1232063.1 hypothetical protein [Listeria booriae]MBC1234035.1 hypothetical protein [Listeria booriae]MBC1246283.1 hypothetical protein [Listeria booriae]
MILHLLEVVLVTKENVLIDLQKIEAINLTKYLITINSVEYSLTKESMDKFMTALKQRDDLTLTTYESL